MENKSLPFSSQQRLMFLKTVSMSVPFFFLVIFNLSNPMSFRLFSRGMFLDVLIILLSCLCLVCIFFSSAVLKAEHHTMADGRLNSHILEVILLFT